MLIRFLEDEEGAQVIEYAMIIALISIALVVALDPTSIAGSFSGFIARVAGCLTTGSCP